MLSPSPQTLDPAFRRAQRVLLQVLLQVPLQVLLQVPRVQRAQWT